MKSYIQRFRLALKYLMRTNDLTQAGLGEIVGLSQAQINRIVSHPTQTGSEEARRNIAAALDTSYEEMLELGLQLMGREVTGKAQDMGLLPNILFKDISVDANDIIEKVLYMDRHDPHSLRLIRPLLESLCADIKENKKKNK